MCDPGPAVGPWMPSLRDGPVRSPAGGFSLVACLVILVPIPTATPDPIININNNNSDYIIMIFNSAELKCKRFRFNLEPLNEGSRLKIVQI